MKVKQIKISELIPDDKNFNKGTEFGMQLLEKSLSKFGAGRSILIDKNNKIIAGNKTLEQAASIGLEKIVVVETDGKELVAVKRKDVDLNTPLGREMALADNATALNNICWDAEVIDAEIIQPEVLNAEVITSWGIKLPKTTSQLKEESEIPLDDNQLSKIQTDIQIGDVIEIGMHRLVCGDSRNPDIVSKVLNGNEPYLMVTDPPYGVKYDPKWRTSLDGRPRASGEILNNDNDKWEETFVLSPSKLAYVWHGGLHTAQCQISLEKSGFEVKTQIIWVKNNHVLGQGHYHWKHEPCFYAKKKNAESKWIGGKNQNTVWEISKVWKADTGHSTQKPIECMGIPISNHKGDVYDPFIGSGTTMVAAHQLGRKCYAIEINPKYCQVVINRMKTLDPAIVVKINGKEV